MSKDSRYIISFLTAFLLLCIGGGIYFCYRPLSLLMFKWLGISGNELWLINLRESLSSPPSWVIYALPDGLWSCAYVIFIGMIWKFNYKECWTIASIIPTIGVLSEIGQAFGWIKGVFDIEDLIMYVFGAMSGFIFLMIMKYRGSFEQTKPIL